MRDALPPGAGWRFDLLPQFVWHCIKTDRILRSHEIGQQLRPASLPMNCFLFLLDLATIFGVTTAGAIKRAAWAYCIELDQWMRRETARWPAYWGRSFLDALDAGRLLEFVLHTPPGGNPRACCRLTLEYAAPPAGATLDYLVYGTLTDVPRGNAQFRPDWLSTTLMRQCTFSAGEVLALRPLFPGLARLLSIQHPEMAQIPTDVMPAPVAIPGGERAEITSLGGKRILTPTGIAWLEPFAM